MHLVIMLALPVAALRIDARPPVIHHRCVGIHMTAEATTARCVMGDESIMSEKAHGTSEVPVQSNLRWQCRPELADRICNYNRRYAEPAGTWERQTVFLDEASNQEDVTFYDSNTGVALFYNGPRAATRSWDDFVSESKVHGWPSFRDSEVNWEHVRVLPDGECVSTSGTHLGHNLPDGKGNRYCINLCSIAGQPMEDGDEGQLVERYDGTDANGQQNIVTNIIAAIDTGARISETMSGIITSTARAVLRLPKE